MHIYIQCVNSYLRFFTLYRDKKKNTIINIKEN